MGFYQIWNSIKAILDTVKDAPWSRLQEVFSYDAPDAGTGYPYAVVSVREAEEEELDTAVNTAVYRFAIRCVDVNKDKAAMEATMQNLADDILAELRKDEHKTLGGTVDRLLPFKTTFSWDNGGNVASRYFEIEIDALKHWGT